MLISRHLIGISLSAVFLAGFFAIVPAHAEKKNLYIDRLATSYLGTVQDEEAILGLDQLIAVALQNNRLIEVARQQHNQSQAQLTQSCSNYLPHLSLEGHYFQTHKEDTTTDILGTENGEAGQDSAPPPADPSTEEEIETGTDPLEEDTVAYGSVNISQLIYDFGKTDGAIKTSRANLVASDARLQRQVQDIILDVKEAYYNVLEKRRLIDVAAESVKNFSQHLERAKVYYEAGVRTRINVINAEVELSNATLSLLKAKYNLKVARVALEQVLGIKPNSGKYTLYNDEIQMDNILATMPPVTESLESLLETAKEKRPDVQQLRALVKAANANVRQLKGNYWPTITGEARYDEYDTDLAGYEDTWQVGVAMRWELFSGFHTKGEVAEARGKLLENIAQMEDLELAVVREVTDSYIRTDENRESVRIALQTLELAKENLLLAEKRYKSGVNDVVEFNDAQLSLTRTQNELVVTYYGYLTALARIEHAVGKYDPTISPIQMSQRYPVDRLNNARHVVMPLFSSND